MSALNFARQAFGREKPHSSITDWVEILTGANIAEEAYDGIPELVDAINLQASGPTEASRAIRKKLKHGNPHQQYRALVLLKALVENCGDKFQTTFADGQLRDALSLIASDPTGNKRVKKKLLLVLGSWKEQFQDDPSMAYAAGLYKQCRVVERKDHQNLHHLLGAPDIAEDQRRIERAKEKEEKRAAKEKAKKEEEERRRNSSSKKTKRVPFDFERDKPKVLESIVEASQASSNLINAITLVNLEKEKLQDNDRVQECLTKAKQARKIIVRYTQLVENEEFIGTLIETNERMMTALEMYDQLTAAAENEDTTNGITSGLAATKIGGEVTKSQDEKKAGVEKSEGDAIGGKERGPLHPIHIHPDLEDLNFGPLGSQSSRLPPPMRPSKPFSDDDDDGDDDQDRRGSLSDFSDYESSDEETHKAAGPSTRREYITVSDDDDAAGFTPFAHTEFKANDDPFADPFADEVAVVNS